MKAALLSLHRCNVEVSQTKADSRGEGRVAVARNHFLVHRPSRTRVQARVRSCALMKRHLLKADVLPSDRSRLGRDPLAT